MTVLILLEDGKQTKVMLDVALVGNEQEPWNPTRIEIKTPLLDPSIILKAYKKGGPKGVLQELVISEDGPLVVLPDKPRKPKASPEYEKLLEEGKIVASRRTTPSHIAFVSTNVERSGIFTYTKYLADALGRLFPVKIHHALHEIGTSALLHTQHEFGIFPYVDELVSKRLEGIYRVVTFHTVLEDPEALLEHYYKLDEAYDALIVHNYLQKKFLRAYTKGEIYVIPHGSYIFEPAPKEQAQLPGFSWKWEKMVFVFGFSADSKGFDEIVAVAQKMPEVLFVISGAVHGIIESNSQTINATIKAKHQSNVVLLERFLDDEAINYYLSACDCVLFNYKTPAFIASASGALHRCLAAGKPIVCPQNDNRMAELEDGIQALKFVKGDLDGMRDALEVALSESDLAEQVGRNARKLAWETSWDKIAKQHIELYGKVIGDLFGPAWYDEAYYAGQQGGKTYFTSGGEEKQWSYYNPPAIWEGAKPIMQAIKTVFEPRSIFSVGEGRGTFVVAAKEVGIEIAHGIDFSYWAVANPNKDASGLLFWGDVRDLSAYKDASYDMIIAFDIMEHIYMDDLDKAINELQRVAAKWIFYNNGSTLHEHEATMTLKKGEFPPKEMQGTSLAGHVTVQPCDWWEKKLTNDRWRSQPLYVGRFRDVVNNLGADDALKNWHCLIATQRVE